MADEKMKPEHVEAADSENAPSAINDMKTRRTGLGRRVWASFTMSCFGCLNMGLPMSMVAATLQQPGFSDYMGLNTSKNVTNLIGTITAMSWLGGAIGIIANSYVCDRFGRKAAFASAILFGLFGAALSAGAQNLTMFCFGRFFTGWSAWSGMLPALVYLQEVAPIGYRGDLNGLVGPVINMGWVTGACIQVGFSHLIRDDAWRYPMIVEMTPQVLMAIWLPFVKESPRWYALNGRTDKALEVFKYLHADKRDPDFLLAKEEAYLVAKQVVIDRSLPSSWYSMFTKYFRRTSAGMLVTFNQCIMGPQIVAQYGVSLYVAAGMSPRMAIAMGAIWYLAGTMCSIFWSRFIDTIGRKRLLLLGNIAVIPIYGIIAALYAEYVQYVDDKLDPQPGRRALIAFFFIYVFFFQINEPASYCYIGEIFPSHLRAKGTASGLASLCITNFWLTYSFPIGVASQGWRFFLLNIILMMVCLVAMAYMVKETRGLTLEEMAAIWGCPEEVAIFSKDIDPEVVEREMGVQKPLIV